jgi:hypothetical protein
MPTPKIKKTSNYPQNNHTFKDMNKFEKLCIEYLCKAHPEIFDDAETIYCKCTHNNLLENEILSIEFHKVSLTADIEILNEISDKQKDKLLAKADIYLSEDARNGLRIDNVRSCASVDFLIDQADIHFLIIPNQKIDAFVKSTTDADQDKPLIEWLEEIKNEDHDYTYLTAFLDTEIPLCELTHRIFSDLFGLPEDDLTCYQETLQDMINNKSVDISLGRNGQNNIILDGNMILNLLYDMDFQNSFLIPDPNTDDAFNQALNSIVLNYIDNEMPGDLDERVGASFDEWGYITPDSLAIDLKQDSNRICKIFERIEIHTTDDEIFFTMTVY